MEEFYFWLGDYDREKPLRVFSDGVAKERKKAFDEGYKKGWEEASERYINRCWYRNK